VDEVLVVISGERDNETVEAVAESQEQVDALFEAKGVAKGVNPYFPDEHYGRNDFNGGLDQWWVVRVPFLSAAQ
jgi:hypothetical protein